MKKILLRDISKMNISLREVASLMASVIIGMFYVSQTYMTKAEAEEQRKTYKENIDSIKQDAELKYEELDKRISNMQDNTESIAKDVSFIRGQIESKRGKI